MGVIVGRTVMMRIVMAHRIMGVIVEIAVVDRLMMCFSRGMRRIGMSGVRMLRIPGGVTSTRDEAEQVCPAFWMPALTRRP